MDNNSEEQKLLNPLDSSEECNFYNDKEGIDFDWQLFLESKFIKCILGVLTIGVYPVYEFAKRHQHKISQDFSECVNQAKNLNDQETKRRHNFFYNLTHYINLNTDSATSGLENKNSIFFATYFLLNIVAIGCTGGLYLVHLAYKHVRTMMLHNSLNAIVTEYKKENHILKQKIMKEKIAYEKSVADHLNESLKEIHGFNYDNCLHESLNSNQESFEIGQKDPFILFIFYSSYALLSILTLGGFCFYVEYQKRVNKVEYNFFDHLLTKEIIDKHDFNTRINNLSNNINFDYASILSNRRNVNSNTLDYTSLFRSRYFKNKLNIFLSLCLLHIITLGAFPVYIFYKVAFHNTEYFLMESYEHKLEYLNIKDNEYFYNKLKVKFKSIYDFYFDAKMSVNIAATKLLRSTTLNKIKPTKDDIPCLFIKTISSPIFKWALTLILLLTNYALWLGWIAAGATVVGALFPCAIIFSVLFVIAISYHLFLLF